MKLFLAAIVLGLGMNAHAAEVEETFFSSEENPISYSGPFDGKGLSSFQDGFCHDQGYEKFVRGSSDFVGFELVYDSITCSREAKSEVFNDDDGDAILYYGPRDGKGIYYFTRDFCGGKGYSKPLDQDYTSYNNVVIFHSITCGE